MGKSLTEKLNALPQARRERIEAETDRLHAEYLTLQELRKARELTQVQLAETLNIRQATVAQMEKRSDLMFCKLRMEPERLKCQAIGRQVPAHTAADFCPELAGEAEVYPGGRPWPWGGNPPVGCFSG